MGLVKSFYMVPLLSFRCIQMNHVFSLFFNAICLKFSIRLIDKHFTNFSLIEYSKNSDFYHSKELFSNSLAF